MAITGCGLTALPGASGIQLRRSCGGLKKVVNKTADGCFKKYIIEDPLPLLREVLSLKIWKRAKVSGTSLQER